MGSSRLPSELTDRIIDFCHNNKRTISTCAFTHSSWLAASRFHLFRTIATTGLHRETSRAIQLASIIRKKSFAVSLRQPSIIPYIKTVKIDSLANQDRVIRLRDAVDLACAIRLFCDRERQPVSSVHVNLSLFMGSDAFRRISLISGMVTHVKLSNATLCRPNEIWSFLSSFPRLQHLVLEDIGFIKSTESGFLAARTFNGVPLSTIRITTALEGPIIDSLIKVADSLSHLSDFGIVHKVTIRGALPQLADAIQRRVKCLRFPTDCYPGDERGNEWRPPAFDMRMPEFVGRFRSLTTFVLDNLRLDYDRSNVSFEWITGALRHLSSPVQKLVFEVTVTNCSQLDAMPWAFIDRTVHPETPQSRALTRVEVLVRRGVLPEYLPPIIDRDVVRSEVALRLPALNLLGLLWCDTTGC